MPQTKEQLKAYYKQWRLDNREKLLADKKKWYQEHREECLERSKIFIRSDKRKEWRKNNKQKNAEYAKQQWLKTKDRKVHIKVYGITLEDYHKMYNDQDGKCAICKVSESELNHTLNIDHCHTTEKVRGLLCKACNQCLGLIDDNITTLNNLINYLSNA